MEKLIYFVFNVFFVINAYRWWRKSELHFLKTMQWYIVSFRSFFSHTHTPLISGLHRADLLQHIFQNYIISKFPRYVLPTLCILRVVDLFSKGLSQVPLMTVIRTDFWIFLTFEFWPRISEYWIFLIPDLHLFVFSKSRIAESHYIYCLFWEKV